MPAAVTIMVVEDHPATLAGLLELLQAAFPSCTLLGAESSEKALRLCEAVAPQVVIMDIALPGISGSTTTALLLPFTITMTPVEAIAFLGALYCAANFGGSITAILVNTPGDPSASATAFDGYPMAVKGEAGRALGISAVASAIGGIFSVVVLIFAAPLLARLAYSFGPPEYFALAVFGLSMVAMTGGDSMVKNLIAGCFGSRAWMSALARQGGKASSAAKRRASRENGRKGGRPKKALPRSDA